MQLNEVFPTAGLVSVGASHVRTPWGQKCEQKMSYLGWVCLKCAVQSLGLSLESSMLAHVDLATSRGRFKNEQLNFSSSWVYVCRCAPCTHTSAPKRPAKMSVPTEDGCVCAMKRPMKCSLVYFGVFRWCIAPDRHRAGTPLHQRCPQKCTCVRLQVVPSERPVTEPNQGWSVLLNLQLSHSKLLLPHAPLSPSLLPLPTP